jgi:hypothetical protein
LIGVSEKGVQPLFGIRRLKEAILLVGGKLVGILSAILKTPEAILSAVQPECKELEKKTSLKCPSPVISKE